MSVSECAFILISFFQTSLGTPSRRAVLHTPLFWLYGIFIMARTGNPNIAEYGKNTRFNGKSAVEASAKSKEKAMQNRRENKLIKDRILERMGEDDWDEFIDGIIARAKDSKADAEFLRDTIGQKPVEKVAVDTTDEAKNELAELLEQRRNAGK